jgi:hypothetical protein
MAKKYKLGDKWSEDFDYDGMVEYGKTIDMDTSEKTIEKYADSLEDVNYHTLAKPLFDLEVAMSGDKEKIKKHFLVNYRRTLSKQLVEFGDEPLSTDEIYFFAKGGLAKGYHKMPDGTIMKDSDHYAEGGEVGGYFEYVNWEDVRRDMKYPESDNNEGLIYGINLIDEESEEIMDVEWYKTSEEREGSIKKYNLKEYEYAKGGEVYDLRDRLIDLGDEDFVEFEEKQSDDPNLLYYTFKERLEDYHGEEDYAKGGETATVSIIYNDIPENHRIVGFSHTGEEVILDELLMTDRERAEYSAKEVYIKGMDRDEFWKKYNRVDFQTED